MLLVREFRQCYSGKFVLNIQINHICNVNMYFFPVTYLHFLFHRYFLKSEKKMVMKISDILSIFRWFPSLLKHREV